MKQAEADYNIVYETLRNSQPTNQTKEAFQDVIYSFFSEEKRLLPWRQTTDPYKIFLSEVMLQQTQAGRVIEKYLNWLEEFPTFDALAQASLQDVLKQWQGLGYNRRAKFLLQSAQKSVSEYSGSIPQDPEKLTEFPGIGLPTASAICTYAFNVPVPYIETNIRTIFLFFFFKDKENIHDKEIMPLVEEMLDTQNPREWYNALMDYGTMLKKEFKNPSRKSKHHIKQKPFKGSNREVRGAILRTITNNPGVVEDELIAKTKKPPKKVQLNLQNLIQEEFIKEEQGKLFIA